MKKAVVWAGALLMGIGTGMLLFSGQYALGVLALGISLTLGVTVWE